MAIRRNGLGVKVGMGPKVGRFVSEVRIAQEVDNRNRHLPAFELWQHIIVDIRAADAGVAEEPTIGLGEQFSVDVNRRAVYHNIREFTARVLVTPAVCGREWSKNSADSQAL